MLQQTQFLEAFQGEQDTNLPSERYNPLHKAHGVGPDPSAYEI